MAPRTVLHPLTAADADDFIAAARASRAYHRPWITAPDTREAFAAYLARVDGRTKASYIARRVADGEPCGWLTLSEIIRGALQGCFLGYAGFVATAGRGHMTEALRLVLAEAFDGLRLHRVEANIQPGNTASIALARRSGFSYEGFSPRYLRIGGEWRDHERWAITEETWRRGL